MASLTPTYLIISFFRTEQIDGVELILPETSDDDSELELFIKSKQKKKKEKDQRLRARLKKTMKKQNHLDSGTQTESRPFEFPLKTMRWFTVQEKKDAIKLLYTSRRAYRLIRREKWMHLPDISSVRRFMQDIKFSPGLNESLMDVLKLRLESMEEDERNVTIRSGIETKLQLALILRI